MNSAGARADDDASDPIIVPVPGTVASVRAPATGSEESRELALLADFDAHALTDLVDASLMDRVDTKFVVPRALLGDLLLAMRDDYSVLEIDGRRSFRYLNDYFDDPDHGFYLAHHAGHLNRYKLRRRTYLDAGTSWLEVKFKSNHERTFKTRMRVEPSGDAPPTTLARFLQRSGITNLARLRVVQTGSYRRTALASEARGERLTIDRALEFRDARDGRALALGPWMVVELKQAAHDRGSPFFRWARARGLRPCAFSKYCMGLYFTGPEDLKRNRFHPVARQLSMRR